MNCLNADTHDELKSLGQNMSYCPFCDNLKFIRQRSNHVVKINTELPKIMVVYVLIAVVNIIMRLETYFVGRKIGKFKEAVRKRRNANKVEVSRSEKKKE